MPIRFSEEFNIEKEDIVKLGVFDVILDVDTRVFIDPALLVLVGAPEFQTAKEEIEKHFSNIITLLSHSKKVEDMYWKRADALLKFKELSGTCFGYSQKGTGGNAIGPILRTNILKTIKELIEEGETDPTLFELLGVFQENIGCDRVSDLVTFILAPHIFSYTNRVVSSLDIMSVTTTYKNVSYGTCVNPYNGKPLMLLPADILSPLPVAESFDDIDFICRENQRVRDEINSYFELGNKKKLSKSDILSYMHRSKTFRDAILSAYKTLPVQPYNFDMDPAGEYVWLGAAKEYTEKFPLELSGQILNKASDVFTIVNIICQKFKNLIENNGLYSLLYDDKRSPKHERAEQLLFFGIADSYCFANNIDLSREINNGRGPVDFKLSRGALDKIVVEVKLTSNNQLKHGIETQLPIYMKQEKTYRAIYLIIDNGHPKALKNFFEFYNKIQKQKVDIITVDGTYRDSASKA